MGSQGIARRLFKVGRGLMKERVIGFQGVGPKRRFRTGFRGDPEAVGGTENMV